MKPPSCFQRLALECPLADPTLFHASLGSLRAGARRLHADRLLVARVERLLVGRGARLSAQTVARLLGLSSRTLARRLRDEGTSYQALVAQVQKSQAECLLSDPELTVAEVAHALGYEDTANVGRAFRRWFGRSPRQHRRLPERLAYDIQYQKPNEAPQSK